MTIAEQMLDTYPLDLGLDKALLARCIDACSECAEACTACADACLSEEGQVDSLVRVHSSRPRLRRHLHGHGSRGE